MSRTRSRIQQLGQFLYKALRHMDQEATTVFNGVEAGLVAYNWHRGGGSEEHAWVKRLGGLLEEAGYSVRYEHRYPGQRTLRGRGKCCDMVVELSPDVRVWLEVKAAWKKYYSREGELRSNERNFHGYWYGGKSHSVAGDLRKLEALDRGHGAYAAVLVVGFDSADLSLDPDVETLTKTERLPERRWQLLRFKPWNDSACKGCRIQVLFWWRDLAAVPTLPAQSGTKFPPRPPKLEEVIAAFDQCYPTRGDFNAKTYVPLLAELGISGEHSERLDDVIRQGLKAMQMGTARDLYGTRGQQVLPECRDGACAVIVGLLKQSWPTKAGRRPRS